MSEEGLRIVSYDESIRVPLLMHCPALFGETARIIDAPIDTVDLMATLLDLCDIPMPDTVEGVSYAGHLLREAPPPREEVVIACYCVFGAFARDGGGVEYRGIRTRRHTYVETRQGPWLLFDNVADPYQLSNLIDRGPGGALQRHLKARLEARLSDRGDTFEPGKTYVQRWGWTKDGASLAGDRPGDGPSR